MKIQNNIFVIASTAVAYFLAFQLNTYLFSSLDYSHGVAWIFLPSGLRLAFILLFVESGAIGVALASITSNYLYQFDGDPAPILGAGLMSGFAPWLARLICIDKLKLDVNLSNLKGSTLLKISVLFAVLSPVLHQLWITWGEHTTNFVSSTAVMAVGDLVGTLVVLYTAKLLLSLVPTSGHKN